MRLHTAAAFLITLASLPVVGSGTALAQAASVADLKGRWMIEPVIVKKHCYTDRRTGFITIGKAIGDESFSAKAWIRFIRQPTGKPGCKAKRQDVHDVVDMAISTYGENGTTNRYAVRVRHSIRHRSYVQQTWVYRGGKLHRLGTDGKIQATLVRRS